MQTVTVRRHIAAPVERVWRLATDLGRAPEVLSGVERVEVLTPGPFGVGTRWRETRRLMRREVTEEMWVTAVDAARSYTVEADSRGVHYVSRFDFAPAGDGGTEVALSLGGQARGRVGQLIGRITGPLARRGVSRALQKDLDDLAAAAESG
jgi:carbon monoxide dehydrogenase subunit G